MDIVQEFKCLAVGQCVKSGRKRCTAALSYLDSFHRPTMQKQKALRTLQTMLVQLFIKAKERAKEKVKEKCNN